MWNHDVNGVVEDVGKETRRKQVATTGVKGPVLKRRFVRAKEGVQAGAAILENKTEKSYGGYGTGTSNLGTFQSILDTEY